MNYSIKNVTNSYFSSSSGYNLEKSIPSLKPLETKTQNQTSVAGTTTFTGDITGTRFIKTGGTSIQYLMADGSSSTSSGTNVSSFYLYVSNTTTTTPTENTQIRYNNAVQSQATLIYISYITRDGIDIEEFLNMITDKSVIFIQHQTVSDNYIKYKVTGPITVIPNSYVTVPVLLISSGGTGTTNFPNTTNIILSITTNQTLIDNRLTSLENKTQNIDLTLTNNTKTKFNNLVEATGYQIPNGLSTQYLLANGTTTSSGGGDVFSSITSTVSGAVPIFDGTSGKLIKGSGVICDFTNSLSNINTITSNGYKTPTGVIGELLTASGSINSTALPNITTLNDKTQNQTATAGQTNFSGLINGLNITTTGISNNTLIGSTTYTGVNALNNCGVGKGALALSGGNNCVAIGVNSQKANLTSGSNISIGTESLEFATECVHNVALGERAMRNTLTGNNNTVIGNFALSECQTNNNVSIGFGSGLGVTNQVNTISIGTTATATTSNQCVIGNSSLTEVKTSGVFNGAGYKTPTGLATDVLCANGTINSNIIPVLTSATSLNTPSTIVSRNTTGDFACGRVSAVGKVAINGIIANNTIATNFTMNNSEMTTLTGAGNVCIGQSCGILQTSASANTFCGQQSGQFLLVGNNNTGIGNSALRNCTASFNTAVGSTCLPGCTTGEYNVGVGWNVLQNLVTATECTSVGSFSLHNNTASFNTALGYNAASQNTIFTNITCLGNASQATASNQVVLGSSAVTEVKSTGVYNSSIGFKTPTGLATDVLCANGTINSNIINNVSYLEDISDWRYQANSYYGATPTTSAVDAEFFMAHLGNTTTVPASSTSNTNSRKYKVQSNITTPADGAVSGWLGGTNTPPIFVRQGFKIVIGFSLGDSTTNAQTRTMIGLFQSTTPPVLNTLTNIASVTTQSLGIVQEVGENVWSFNTRGSTSSTKVATTISCQTPTTTWYVLEMINFVNSTDILMKLTSQDGTSASQLFTCGLVSTMSTTGLNFIQLQRNMASVGGLTGSAILQTSSFRLWSSV
jgi:hypothetical protein